MMQKPKPSLGVRLRGRAQTRPGKVDVVMVGAAAASYGYHTVGITLVGAAVLFALWIIMWQRWFVTKAGLAGAVISLVVLSMMVFGPKWQLGFEVTRGCFVDKADAALSAVEPGADLRQPMTLEEAGRCGPLTYRWVKVINAQPFDDRSGASAPSVWFEGAGITNWDIFGGNGFVYSPTSKPWCEQRIVGDVHGCWMSDLDAGWYAYEYDSNIN